MWGRAHISGQTQGGEGRVPCSDSSSSSVMEATIVLESGDEVGRLPLVAHLPCARLHAESVPGEPARALSATDWFSG